MGGAVVTGVRGAAVGVVADQAAAGLANEHVHVGDARGRVCVVAAVVLRRTRIAVLAGESGLQGVRANAGAGHAPVQRARVGVIAVDVGVERTARRGLARIGGAEAAVVAGDRRAQTALVGAYVAAGARAVVVAAQAVGGVDAHAVGGVAGVRRARVVVVAVLGATGLAGLVGARRTEPIS